MIKYATVTDVTQNAYKVKFLGEEQASVTVYKKLGNYEPVVGHTVAFLVDEKGKYLCLGATQQYGISSGDIPTPDVTKAYVDTQDAELSRRINGLSINKAEKEYVDAQDANLSMQINGLSEKLDVKDWGFDKLKNKATTHPYRALVNLSEPQLNELGLPNIGYGWWWIEFLPDIITGSQTGTYKAKNYHTGDVFEYNVNGGWLRLATTTKTDILFTPKPSFTILNQKNSKINNVLHINVEVAKTDGSMFAGGQFVNIATLPFNVWNTSVSMIGSYGGFFHIAGCGIAYETHLAVIPSKECQAIRISGVIVL